MPRSAARRLEWSPRARDAFRDTIAYIAAQDPYTAARVAERVEQALALIVEQPGIGAPASRPGERRYPVPQTGHVLVYRVTRTAIRVHLWHRDRQSVGR